MSNQEITIVLDKREVVGKGLGKMRREGHVPAVIHQPGKDSINVTAGFVDVTKVFLQAGKHAPVTATVDGNKLLTIIKDVDLHPTKHTIRHIVFGVINKNDKVHTEVPVELVGDAPALKAALLVHQNADVLEISALPQDLVDSIKVNVESLVEVGDKIIVGDIVAPKGITILTDPEHPVVTVDAAHVQSEEPEVSPAEAEAAAVAAIAGEDAEEPKAE